MNRIIVVNDKIKDETENISFKDSICHISTSTTVFFEIKDYTGNIDFIIDDSIDVRIIILNQDSNVSFHYEVGLSSKVIVSSFSKNSSGIVSSYLNKEKAKFFLHSSLISDKKEEWKVDIIHRASYTESNVISHFVSLKDKTILDITGSVSKEYCECICNQDSKIINLGDGECTILPKLLIDNFDVVANHSAYIGKFSKDILFYLESRGLSEKESYSLLMKSFLFGSMELEEEIKELFYQQIESVEV